MAARSATPLDWERLGAREREIMEALFARKEATVAEVLAGLKNPPTYSSVRGMLALLEQKGHVRHRRDGLRYVYAPVTSIASAQGSALKRLVDTFFGGSSARAVATLLELPHDSDDSLTIKELRKAVLKARERGK
jgi:BlaI family transcriptional regulator, penicillinase repressor